MVSLTKNFCQNWNFSPGNICCKLLALIWYIRYNLQIITTLSKSKYLDDCAWTTKNMSADCLDFGSLTAFIHLPCLNPFHIGVFNKPKGGGADMPPLVIWLSEGFFIIFFKQGSFLGCKGLESKSTALYLQNSSPQNFLKNWHFWRKSNKMENSLFRNQTFHPKNVCQNKPRHLQCSSFFA